MADRDETRSGAERAAKPRYGADLARRSAAGVVLAVAALVVAWVGGFTFLAFWLVAAILVLWEWQRLVEPERLWRRVAAGAVALVAAAPLARANSKADLAALVVVLALGAAGAGLVAPQRARVWAAGGVVYAGALVGSLVALRASPSYGFAAILWLCAVVWGADVAAFFAGRSIGGPRLWPSVSPGKTWSGALVGVVVGGALGLALAPFANSVKSLFVLGLAAAVVSIFGDLFESAVKRRFGAKDSSHLIPGHGGAMDRLDAFAAAALFVALVAAWRTTGSFIASGLFEW